MSVSVHFETSLASIVDGKGRTVGADAGAGLGAVDGDAWRPVVQDQRLLPGCPEKMTGCLFLGENASITSRYLMNNHNGVNEACYTVLEPKISSNCPLHKLVGLCRCVIVATMRNCTGSAWIHLSCPLAFA